MQGDFFTFDDHIRLIARREWQLSSWLFDDLKMGFVDDTVTPATSTPNPTWKGAGTAFGSAGEQQGGNFPLNGVALTNVSADDNDGLLIIVRGVPPTLVAHASNPTAVHWGILYNNSVATKPAIGALELRSAVGVPLGDVTIDNFSFFHPSLDDGYYALRFS